MNLGRKVQRASRPLTKSIQNLGRLLFVKLPRSIHLTGLARRAFEFPKQDWVRRLRQELAHEKSETTWAQRVNPLYWIAWSFRFSIRWLVTRPYTAIVPALPAIVVGVAMCAGIAVFLSRDTTSLQSQYTQILNRALVSGDTKQASVAVERLLSIDPYNIEHRFRKALLDEELGKTESASAAMLRLATNKEHGGAALWVFTKLIEKRASGNAWGGRLGTSGWTTDEIQLCHRLVSTAIEKLPTNDAFTIRGWYAGFLADIGDYGDSFRIYEMLSERSPQFYLPAAQMSAQLNDYDRAQQLARTAVRFLEPIYAADPSVIMNRITLAQALVLDERDEDAFNLLTDGMTLSAEPLLREVAAEVLVFKVDRLFREQGDVDSRLERAKNLAEALKLAPQNHVVIEMAIKFTIECRDSKDALEQMLDALRGGDNPAAMHFISGTIYLMSKDLEKAQFHLEIAARTAPKMAGILNNLAYALANRDNEHLEEALLFAEEALRQMPDHPYVRETRGQIFLKMERYQDAISDLEAVVANASIEPSIKAACHKGLSEAYKALGKADFEKFHREQHEVIVATASNQANKSGG